jgi:colanic acid/amylovoran biosynthesis glycosyltransferase
MAERDRIGHLIPEFPGQTHIFFWREMKVLRDYVDLDLVSTRRPPSAIISHAWASDAQRRTVYLADFGWGLAGAVWEILRSGPGGWARCWLSILRAEGTTRERLRLVTLAFIGARLAHLGRRRGWKHLHVHSCADSANIALFAFLLSGLPYSLTLHGPLGDYGGNQREKWRHAKFSIVITHYLLEQVSKTLKGSLPPRVRIAPMGVDLETFSRSVPYRPWEGQGPCRIFSCGRLHPGKGHASLITAVAALRREGLDARLEIAGEDEQGGTGYRRELEQHIAGLGMDEHVRLLGAVREAEVVARLESAHVFALASLSEPLGVAVMEAMAMEVPAVVVESEGVKELIEHGRTGILVSHDALAGALLGLLRDRSLGLQLSRAGREAIFQNFQSRRSAELQLQLISGDVVRDANRHLVQGCA